MCPRHVLKAVLFDFDLTLTVRDGIDMHRVFPERGFGGSIDVSWLQDKAFGGVDRFTRLRNMLDMLMAQGVELHIVSFADRQLIERALTALDLQRFFGERITGSHELDGTSLTAKGQFIRSLMELRSWRREEVLFVDDQAMNLRSADGLCLLHWVRGRGLSVDDMIAIECLACRAAIADDQFATAGGEQPNVRKRRAEPSELVNLV
mmetsp:Transcript_108431/g.192050  ORF Transcript_108431/g.192050 Transcript_108431/m.192050 type:complete len:206 (+) Transcript_108431:1-618(+)